MKANTPNTAIFGEAIIRLLNSDFKDELIEELAREMLLDPTTAVELTAHADASLQLAIKAAVERAKALNAPKQALLDLAGRCKKRGGYHRSDYRPGQVAFHFYLPYVLMPLSKEHGPHVYMPCNRDYAPIGELGKVTGGSFWRYEDYPERAWHFRGDPREIEGAWLDRPNVLYLYGGGDKVEYKSERAFMARYRDRLRRVLAEAVPGVGGLSPKW